MRRPSHASFLSMSALACLLMPAAALAQNWSFDARRVGLGGVGSTANVALSIVDEQRRYRAIVLPFGLAQVLPNKTSLDPTKDEFDLVRTIEYAASPIHYIVGRDDTSTASFFVNDLRNGTLHHDLNDYRIFSPSTSTTAEGLASPNWGHTFKIRKGDNGAFQGVYAGGGIYFSVNTATEIDPELAKVFSSPIPVYVPNTSFHMSNDTESQFAAAITGGYRGRFAVFGAGSGDASHLDKENQALDGLYVGANVHFLRGFGYEHFVPAARLDTNAQGLLFVKPGAGVPVSITRTSSSGGTGLAADVGAAVIKGPWELGLGVNGIGNRINWTDLERTQYVLDSLFAGGEFNDLPPVPVDDLTLKLPVDVRGDASYDAGSWMAITEFGHGYNGTSVRVGYEQRLDRLQLRGGARYIKERWEPTGGAGFNMSDRVGIDLGLFSTSANLERRRKLGIAVSVRLMLPQP